MGFFKEFKEFAVKGNVIDLAVAVVLGAAFGAVVTAVTQSIIMPIISLVTGAGGVSKLSIAIGSTVFPYGILLQAIIDFILIALVLFLIIKAMNKLMRKKEAPAAEPKAPEYTLTEKLLMEIRDDLKQNNSI
jgi:large conductance mechanosensitive channel